MGIDISHSLLVGCSYDELEEFIQRKIDEDDNGEYPLDDQGVVEEYFESASSYYDTRIERCFFGFPLPNFTEPNQAWFEELDKACARFEELTGVKAKIRGGCKCLVMTTQMKKEIKRLEALVDYYEGLLDFLDDMTPCLGELILLYDEQLNEAGDD